MERIHDKTDQDDSQDSLNAWDELSQINQDMPPLVGRVKVEPKITSSDEQAPKLNTPWESGYRTDPHSEQESMEWKNDRFSEYYSLSTEEINELDLDIRLQIYDAWGRGQMPYVTRSHFIETWTDDFREAYWNSSYAEVYLNERREVRINHARVEHPEIYSYGIDNEKELTERNLNLVSQIPDYVHDNLYESYYKDPIQCLAITGILFAAVLKLETVPKVEFVETDDKYLQGGQKHGKIKIYRHSGEELDYFRDMNTIAHECWHCYQDEHAESPKDQHDELYKINSVAYITAEMDYEAYRNQIIEAEAFDFGNCFEFGCKIARVRQRDQLRDQLKQMSFEKTERDIPSESRTFGARILNILKRNNPKAGE